MASIIFLSDNETIAVALAPALLQQGINLERLADPAQLIAKATETRPLMVIIDTAVALGKGMDTLAEFRKADPAIANTPVILADATGDLVVISRALQFHIADYFVTGKFETDQVIAKIMRKLPETSGIAVPKEMVKASTPDSVLLIEDDRFLRDLAMMKFSQDKSLTVSAAMDGEQGMALAEKNIPDVVLLDILLPGIDGFEVLRRLREKQQFNRTIICMLSNFGQREDIDRAMSLGANMFFVKANYTLDEIVVEVKNLLAKRKR